MALINTDWTKELNQVNAALGKLVDEKLSPMIKDSIQEAGSELIKVVSKAGEQLGQNIGVLSKEIHDQRKLTKDDIISLIDYASEKIGKTIDERILRIKKMAVGLLFFLVLLIGGAWFYFYLVRG
jgi:hypothetical protein